MARTDPFPVDRPLALARRGLRLFVYTLAVGLGVGFSVLVLVGTLLAVRQVTDSRTLGSLVALVAFGLAIALPVYWLVVRETEDEDEM
ncbi:hypothetical protein [Natronomonas amylolytica]|uniref:hypothetical protein n=1 Tax=Natronomonas amylolytica TaxID=3108498 RepID=UPI00300965C6